MYRLASIGDMRKRIIEKESAIHRNVSMMKQFLVHDALSYKDKLTVSKPNREWHIMLELTLTSLVETK